MTSLGRIWIGFKMKEKGFAVEHFIINIQCLLVSWGAAETTGQLFNTANIIAPGRQGIMLNDWMWLKGAWQKQTHVHNWS